MSHDNDEIAGYFRRFTALRNLRGETNRIITRIYGDIAINSGFYTFTYIDDQEKLVLVPARFTFVYRRVNAKWLIIEHHSSVVPEPMS